VLVAHGGKLVFERHFTGSDEIRGRPVGKITFNADTLNNVKSVSKSVASLAVGIALDRGLIRSIDEPIFNFFPELSDLRSPEKDRIQLGHAKDERREVVQGAPRVASNHHVRSTHDMNIPPSTLIV